MAPAILHRIIHGSSTPEPWQKELLTTTPAILPGYKRYRVQHADYPAILPSSSKDASVLGVVVSGLTEGDMLRLDAFEGSSYEKCTVKIRVLKKDAAPESYAAAAGDDADDFINRSLQRGLEQTARISGSDNIDDNEIEEVVEALTYVWTDLGSLLDLQSEWDFDSFKKEKLQWWISAPESEL